MELRLTVIIPVFNNMPFLQEAIESILTQTYRDFQLLVINDGSTDDSLTYLRTLTDPRIKIINQPNLGLCNSLNNAIYNQVKTEWVARLDADDIALPNRLEEQVNFMIKNPNYSCVFSQIYRIGGSGREFGYYQINSTELITDYHLEKYGSIIHSTGFFQREKFIEVGGYRSFLYPVDDYDLLLRFSEKFPVAVINKPLVKYRIHGESATFKVFWKMQTYSRYVVEMYHRLPSSKTRNSPR